MTNAAVEAKAERTLKTFFDEARSLNGTAGQVKKAFRTGGVVRHARKRSYLQLLRRLERTIHEIAVEIDAEPKEEAAAGSSPRAQAHEVGSQPAAVRAKLDSMVERGELLASAQFAVALGWTRQALSKALAANRVFYVDFKGDRYFPAFFADPAYQRSQLEAASKALGDLPGGAKLQFFLNRRGSLSGETPLAALAQGKLQKVKALAEDFSEGR